jgi:transcriptional regulator with XRE-family HTH domain
MAVPASAQPPARHDELADLLRSRRERLRPEDVGLPPGRRRRTVGLRREEVALLASISATYYAYLEQGRELRPSREVLDALARALRLTPAERRHIHEIAHGSPPVDDRAAVSESASAAVCALVARMDPYPSYVKGGSWAILAANRSARAMFEDWGMASGGGVPNMLWWMFTHERARSIYVDWPTEAARMLARFRMAAARRPEDPGFRDLIERLQLASPEFAATWDRHEVQAQSGGHKVLVHPALGTFDFEHVVLHVADAPDQTLVTFTPAGGNTERLGALAALRPAERAHP